MSIRSNSNRDTGTSYKVRPYASEMGVPSYSNYFVLETLNYKCSLFTSNQVCSLLLPPNTYCIRQLAHSVVFSFIIKLMFYINIMCTDILKMPLRIPATLIFHDVRFICNGIR